jgi:hypothetical protein
MNWLKLAAIAIGALIAFLIVGSVVGFILHVISYVVIAALIAGGGYVAYKIASSGRGRLGRGPEGSDRRRDRELRDGYRRPDPREDLRQDSYTPSPPPPQPSRASVDDELDRLRREMGS